MTKAQKLRALLAVLGCAPAAGAMTGFESAARAGDLDAFWAHFQTALTKNTSRRLARVDTDGTITLQMLEPAMTALYELPATD
jgi:hypothetical protein